MSKTGISFRKGSHWRKVYIPLNNGKYRQEYFNLDTADIKVAEYRNNEISLNIEKIKLIKDITNKTQIKTTIS